MGPISIALVDDHPLNAGGRGQPLFERKRRLSRSSPKGPTADDALQINQRASSRTSWSSTCSCPAMSLTSFTEIVTNVARHESGGLYRHDGKRLCGARAQCRSQWLRPEGQQCRRTYSRSKVRAAHCGETYITPGFACKVIEALRIASLRQMSANAPIKLSLREEQIVRLLLRGYTNRQISVGLGIGEKTVKNYMTILMQKLHARNRLEVLIAAQKLEVDNRGENESISRH